MKDNKVFIQNLIDGISTTPGKGVKYVDALSYVRFNKFQPGTLSRYITDLVDSENPYTSVIGMSNSSGRYDASSAQLVGNTIDLYAGRTFTNMNLAGQNIKVTDRYIDRILSLGQDFLGTKTFFVKENVASLTPTSNGALTFIFRVMLDTSRTGSTNDLKSIISIADPVTAASVFCISASAANQISASVVGSLGSNSGTITLDKGKWYTVVVRYYVNAVKLWAYEVSDQANQVDYTIGTGTSGPLLSLDNPTMYIGYGEVNGGVNTAFAQTDFITGVHLAELAVFNGELDSETIGLIAQAHLKRNQFSSGINSRPVKRVQQIFDSMTSYPASQHNSGQRLTDRVIAPFDSTKKPTFGKLVSGSGQPDNPRMMLYPEMIPADLMSGSGGFWYNGSYSPYFQHDGVRPGIRGNPQQVAGEPISTSPTFGYKDIRSTPFENRLVTTGAIVPGAIHKETELLNIVTYGETSLTASYYAALGGRLKPFDDNQGGSSFVINKPVSDWPEFDQKLGDVVAIEIPIPTTGDCRMGVDETQGRIASMAYYNFADARWDRVGFMPGISGSNLEYGAPPVPSFSKEDGRPKGTEQELWYGDNWVEDVRQFLVNSCSIGFSGTSGFSILEDEFENALAELTLRGRPTSTYGFPHTDQYVASDNQTIDMSDFIDAPFLVQRIAVEIDGEVEESGPSSLGTTIRTRSKWVAQKGPGSVTEGYTATTAGLPGVGYYYAGGGSNAASSYGQLKLGQGLIHNYPSFIGGSVAPGMADVGALASGDANVATSADPDGHTIFQSITNQASGFNTPSHSGGQYARQDKSNSVSLNCPARIFLPQVGYAVPIDRLPGGVGNYGPPPNSIKLLFGGISGLVTGSFTDQRDASAYEGRWMSGIDLYHPVTHTLQAGERIGGVPFWRCDTFFLMRQHPGRERFVGGTAEVYATNIANNYETFPTTADDVGSSHKYTGMGTAFQHATVAYNPESQRENTGPTVVRIEETVAEFQVSTRTTKRDLITYAQLTHYGYAAAEQTLTASLFPTRYYYDSQPGPSSWTTDNENTSDGALHAGNPAMLSSSAVYTQAMKWSSMGYATPRDYQYIPGLTAGSTANPMQRHSDEIDDLHAGSGNGILWKFTSYTDLHKERTERMTDSIATTGSKYGGGPGNIAPLAPSQAIRAECWDWRYSCGTNFNSPFDCLWASGHETLRVLSGSDIGQFGTNINSALTAPEDLQHVMVDWKTQRWAPTAIQRAGFSIVTSPCIPTIEGYDAQFDKYGSFTKAGFLTTEGGRGGYNQANQPLVNYPDAALTSSKAPIRFKNWLEQGLGRDENIYVKNLFTHKRTDIYGGKAGFTILTCSLPFVPGDLTGRFNGDHCIRGTFFEKRLLNAASFRIEAPIRQTPVIISDSSHLFCHTTAPGYLLGTFNDSASGLGPYDSFSPTPKGKGTRISVNHELKRFSIFRRWWRCVPRNHAWLGDVGSANSTTNVGMQTSLTSGRRFFTSIATDKPLFTGSVPGDVPGPGSFPNAFACSQWPALGYGGTASSKEIQGPSLASSSSLGSSAVKESMYILQPKDRLVLGFQPSLHGSNRGNNTIPANPNVNPYGPWRDGVWQRNEICTQSLYNAEEHVGDRVDSRGQPGGILRNRNNVNLESLYEPRQSFNIKSSQSAKLILYGTYVRNNKSAPSSTSQQLRSNAVHEMISGGPVVDQFQTDNVSAYSGSYIAEQVTGSVFHNTNQFALSTHRRFTSSVKGSAGSPGVWANPGLRTSGSFQRFVRIPDTSEVFFDSLPPNPAQMFDIDLVLSGGINVTSDGNNPGVNFSIVGSRERTDISDTGPGGDGCGVVHLARGNKIRGNARWLPSFPFEARYKSVKRAIQWPKPGFGTTGSISNLWIPSSSYGLGRGKNNATSVRVGNTSAYNPSNQYDESGSRIGPWVDSSSPEDVVPRWVMGIQIAEPWDGDPTRWSRFGSRANGAAPIWTADGTAIVMAALYGFWKTPTGRFPTLVSNGADGWSNLNTWPANYGELSHPSGWKYGLMNFRRTATSSVYRYDRYGQFRDQLEQRKYGRFYEYGDDINTAGLQEAAVTCIFVDSEGDPVTDPTTTTCNNLSQEMTSSIPYKEGETSRPPILTTEPITISSLI